MIMAGIILMTMAAGIALDTLLWSRSWSEMKCSVGMGVTGAALFVAGMII